MEDNIPEEGKVPDRFKSANLNPKTEKEHRSVQGQKKATFSLPTPKKPERLEEIDFIENDSKKPTENEVLPDNNASTSRVMVRKSSKKKTMADRLETVPISRVERLNWKNAFYPDKKNTIVNMPKECGDVDVFLDKNGYNDCKLKMLNNIGDAENDFEIIKKKGDAYSEIVQTVIPKEVLIETGKELALRKKSAAKKLASDNQSSNDRHDTDKDKMESEETAGQMLSRSETNPNLRRKDREDSILDKLINPVKNRCLYYGLVLSISLASHAFIWNISIVSTLLSTIANEKNYDMQDNADKVQYLAYIYISYFIGRFLGNLSLAGFFCKLSPVKSIRYVCFVQFAVVFLVMIPNKFVLVGMFQILGHNSEVLNNLCISMVGDISPSMLKSKAGFILLLTRSIICILCFCFRVFDNGGCLVWRIGIITSGVICLIAALLNCIFFSGHDSPTYLFLNGKIEIAQENLFKYMSKKEVDIKMIETKNFIESTIKKPSSNKYDDDVEFKIEPEPSMCEQLFQIYGKETCFSIFLSILRSCSFGLLVYASLSLLFIVDQNDEDEQNLFSIFCPLYQVVESISLIINFIGNCTNKRKSTLMTSWIIQITFFTLLIFAHYFKISILAKLTGFVFFVNFIPFYMKSWYSIRNDTLPLVVMGLQGMVEIIFSTLLYVFVLPQFHSNQNLLYAFYGIVGVLVALFIAQYFVIFETYGLTRLEIFLKFRTKDAINNNKVNLVTISSAAKSEFKDHTTNARKNQLAQVNAPLNEPVQPSEISISVTDDSDDTGPLTVPEKYKRINSRITRNMKHLQTLIEMSGKFRTDQADNIIEDSIEAIKKIEEDVNKPDKCDTKSIIQLKQGYRVDFNEQIEKISGQINALHSRNKKQISNELFVIIQEQSNSTVALLGLYQKINTEVFNAFNKDNDSHKKKGSVIQTANEPYRNDKRLQSVFGMDKRKPTINSNEVQATNEEVPKRGASKKTLWEKFAKDIFIPKTEEEVEAEKEAERYARDHYDFDKAKTRTEKKRFQTEVNNFKLQYLSKRREAMVKPEWYKSKDAKDDDDCSDDSKSDHSSDEEKETEADKIFNADTGKFGVDGPILIYDGHVHVLDTNKVHYSWTSIYEDLYNKPRGSFNACWPISQYKKDIELNKKFKTVKANFVEVAAQPEWAQAEAKWILGEADPDFMNICPQIPVPFGREAVTEFLNQLRNKKTNKLPKNLKGGRIMWVDETMRPKLQSKAEKFKGRSEARRFTCESVFLSGTKDYQSGLEVLAENGQIWHMTGTPNFLPNIIAIVRSNPNNNFMIDHLCLEQAGECFDTWEKDITALSCFPNVGVNLGGIEIWDLTETSPQKFLQHALRVFGYDRCQVGTNWYQTEAQNEYYSCSLEKVLVALETLGASDEEKRQVFYKNARLIYG